LTLLGLKLQPLGRPARSQSLYQLHYPGSPLQNQVYTESGSKFLYVLRYRHYTEVNMWLHTLAELIPRVSLAYILCGYVLQQ
jgi:hypothetical protein